MNKLEKQIKKHIIGLYNLSPVVENGYRIDFSKIPCETCGNKLAGERFKCLATIGKKHTDRRKELEICVDCFEYFFT